jgi:6-phosphogluconolactonase
MKMNAIVQVAENSEELSRLAAENFVHFAVEAVRENGLFTVALAGGSTPRNFYSLLSDPEKPFRTQVPWDKIHFCWGDERHVPPDHPDSNYRMARETLLSKVPVPSENIHRIKGEIAEASEAADQYDETLRELFRLGAGRFPRFHLILLGLGSDGHTVSIFPGSEVINENRRLVVATPSKDLKTDRITLTPPVLNKAQALIFLVSGSEKAQALHEVLEGEYEPERLPAQLTRANKSTVLWFVDEQAASMLRSQTTS